MTNYICPFARYVERTFYPCGNLKTETDSHPLRNLASIGIPMAAVAATVNGLVAYFSGVNPWAPVALGGSFAYEFFLADLIGHQMKGDNIMSSIGVLF